jgi:hypothetical protein
VEAAKNGYEYRPDDTGTTWTLIKKTQQPVLRVDPEAVNSPEVQDFVRVFRLRPGLIQYDITQEALNPFPSTYPPEGVTRLDLETRSLLQALYYVSTGIDIPPEHTTRGAGDGYPRRSWSCVRLGDCHAPLFPRGLGQGEQAATGRTCGGAVQGLLVLHRGHRPGDEIHVLALDGVGTLGTSR